MQSSELDGGGDQATLLITADTVSGFKLYMFTFQLVRNVTDLRVDWFLMFEA